MMDFYKHLRQIGACRQGVEWCRENGVTTAAEAWNNLCDSNKHEWVIWFALNSPIVPREHVAEFLTHTVTRAILAAKTVCKEPNWNRWADAWLAGEDRSANAAKEQAASTPKTALHPSALVASAAAMAAAWAAAWAAHAPNAAQSSAYAAQAQSEAWQAEKKTQADWWRGQKNPFEEAAK
jgi:hypothetical protein